jgi:hypothetical protein
MTLGSDRFSAREQGLGYIYQPRLALLKLFQLPESTSVLIEKDDDLDFVAESGRKSLASLKHKATGNRITDLSADFWKSVRIWLLRYDRDRRSESDLRFFLFTTSRVSEGSFLENLLDGSLGRENSGSTLKLAMAALETSTTELSAEIGRSLKALTEEEGADFFSRIVIFHASPRIQDLPLLIQEQHLRSIRREFRAAVFQRLEGWWNDLVIQMLCGERENGIFGYELSDKLSLISEEYKTDNLPIEFRDKLPTQEVDEDGDRRLFVIQLRQIGIASSRIRNAILDYYRAFEQRSAWAREHLLNAGEMEAYEDRLVDEWTRYRDVLIEELGDESAEKVLVEVGRALYRWADLESGNTDSLRIRTRVTEPYVVRGAFHILANMQPVPRIYWHPLFLSRIDQLLGVP